MPNTSLVVVVSVCHTFAVLGRGAAHISSCIRVAAPSAQCILRSAGSPHGMEMIYLGPFCEKEEEGDRTGVLVVGRSQLD